MPKENKDLNKTGKDFARYTSLAFEMMVIIGGGTWGAFWLDEQTGSEIPWFTITLAPLSVVASILLIVKDLTGKK